MKKIIYVVICLLALQSHANAQGNVNINMAIAPPYSTKISDYANNPGKVIITLTYVPPTSAGGDLRILLKGSVTGNNGIVLSTKANYKPNRPLVLQPNVPMVVDLQTISELFDVNALSLQGITAKDIIDKGGLPEGNYQFCVRAYLYDSPTTPVSGANPQGCTTIRMTQLEPPILVKPMNNETVLANQVQNLLLNWNIPAGAEPGTQYVLRIVEMLDPNKNPNDAMNAKTTPAFFETTTSNNIFLYGPAQPTLIEGRKYAWCVTALPGPVGSAFRNNGRSEVRSFVYGTSAPKITLTLPIDKAVVEPNGGDGSISLTWTYPNNIAPSVETPYVVEVKPNQTIDQAFKQNENLALGKEVSKYCWMNANGFYGKTIAWKTTITVGSKTYTSDIQTFTIAQDLTAIKEKMKTFELCGFPVTVTNLQLINGYRFKGDGYTQIKGANYKINLHFDNLEIKPFVSFRDIKGNVTGFDNWVATSNKGKITVDKFLNSNKFYLSTPTDVQGNLKYISDAFVFYPSVAATWSDKNYCFENKQPNSSNAAYAKGKAMWSSVFLDLDGKNPYIPAVFEDDNADSLRINYEGYLSGSFYLSYRNKYGTLNQILFREKEYLFIKPYVNITSKNSTTFSFTGSYVVQPVANGKKGVTAKFLNVSGLSFDLNYPEGYYEVLNNNGSAVAKFDKLHLNLLQDVNNIESINIYELGVSIPELEIVATTPSNTKFSIFLKQIPFSGVDGLTINETEKKTKEILYNTFTIKLKSSKIHIAKSVLNTLSLSGDLTVPLINQKADFMLSIAKEGFKSASLTFKNGQTSTIYKDANGNTCTFKGAYGCLPSGTSIYANWISCIGYLNFTSPNGNSGLNIQEVPVYFAVNAEGDLNKNYFYGWDSQCQVPSYINTAGKFNGFDFTAVNCSISKDFYVAGKYKIELLGSMMLADNLAYNKNNTSDNFSVSIDFLGSQVSKGGAAYAPKHFANFKEYLQYKKLLENKETSFNSKCGAAAMLNPACDFDIKLTYYDKDPVYGTGFGFKGEFMMKEPSNAKIKARMLAAKAPGGFNYWYLSAGEENLLEIPTGVLDLSMYDFEGRIYYKMNHATNGKITDDNYVPDDSKYIGIYGKTKLKTSTDQGKKFWGDGAFELLTGKQGLESVRFLLNGNFVSEGVGSTGIINATDCTIEMFPPEKRLKADFTAVVKMALTAPQINTNFILDICPKSLLISGKAYTHDLLDKKAYGEVGFEITDKYAKATLAAKIDPRIERHFDFWICKPDVYIYASVNANGEIQYNPFHVKAEASFNGEMYVGACRLNGYVSLNVGAQVEFPNPTCAAAGIAVETPLKDFDFWIGIKSGSIIFDKCWN